MRLQQYKSCRSGFAGEWVGALPRIIFLEAHHFSYSVCPFGKDNCTLVPESDVPVNKVKRLTCLHPMLVSLLSRVSQQRRTPLSQDGSSDRWGCKYEIVGPLKWRKPGFGQIRIEFTPYSILAWWGIAVIIFDVNMIWNSITSFVTEDLEEIVEKQSPSALEPIQELRWNDSSEFTW